MEKFQELAIHISGNKDGNYSLKSELVSKIGGGV